MSQPTLCLVCGRICSGVIAFLAHKCEETERIDTASAIGLHVRAEEKIAQRQMEIAELERMYGEGAK